ncbi:MAG TPA: hypothetical protein VMV74_05760, partial [Bacteroidales bacterium]|nr:hypothetical protein [Bacteroidales bacterium]
LHFEFNHIKLPLYHYHYDRFITPDDQINGKWSMMFGTDAQGGINQVKVSLDEKEVIFNRKADPKLRDPDFLKKLEGKYELNNSSINVVFRNNELVMMSTPPLHLEPYKDNMFRIREFSDQIVEFIFDIEGKPTSFRYTAGGSAVTFIKKE